MRMKNRKGKRERDADQLITAANGMLIYPGAVSMPKFKHQQQRHPETQRSTGAMPGDDLRTKLDQHNGLLKVHIKYMYDNDNNKIIMVIIVYFTLITMLINQNDT